MNNLIVHKSNTDFLTHQEAHKAGAKAHQGAVVSVGDKKNALGTPRNTVKTRILFHTWSTTQLTNIIMHPQS